MSCSSTTASPRGPDISWRTVTKHILPERPCLGSMRAMRESRLTSSPMRSTSWNPTRLPANMRLGRGTGGMNCPWWGWPSGPSRDCRSSGVNRTTYQPLGIASPRRYGLSGTSSRAARRLIAASDTSSLACCCLPIHSWRVSAMALPEIQRGVYWTRRHSAPLSSINHGNTGAPAFCADLSDDFLGSQPVEFAVAESEERAQHLTRMLAEAWRRDFIFDRRFRKSHRAGDSGQRPRERVRHFDLQPAVPHLRILEDLAVVVDRAAGHVGRFEPFDPVLARAPLHDFADKRDQPAAVADAVGHREKALVVCELGTFRGLAEARPLAVVSRGENHVAVGGREHLVRKQVGVGVAVAPGHLARGEIIEDLIRPEGDDGVEQRHVDVLPLADALAMRDRRGYRQRAVHPREDIGNGDAHFLRAAPRKVVAFSGDAHEAAHALEDEVVARALRIRTGLAEPGHRAIHDLRVDLFQVLVRKPVLGQPADFVVFDHHVGFQGEFARDALALGSRDVERHRFLSAVEIGRASC